MEKIAFAVLSAVNIARRKTKEFFVAPVEENEKELPSGKNLRNHVIEWMYFSSTRIKRKFSQFVDHCPAGYGLVYC